MIAVGLQSIGCRQFHARTLERTGVEISEDDITGGRKTRREVKVGGSRATKLAGSVAWEDTLGKQASRV